MRFFTAELYRRINAADPAEAGAADAEWERAAEDYQLHLESLKDLLPEDARSLAGLCLHDAELLFPRVQSSKLEMGATGLEPAWQHLIIVPAVLGRELISLVYQSARPFAWRDAPSDWPFSADRKHWLYDEVDVPVDRSGTFVHRILFSDGRELEISALSVAVHRWDLNETMPRVASRKTA